MVNRDIFLIGEDVVKQKTSLQDNIEDQQIRIHILEAQDIDLQSVLCEELYAVILSGVSAYEDCIELGGTCDISSYLTPKQVKLLDDYIEPFLIYTTLYHSRNDLFLTITNRGISAMETDRGKEVSKAELEFYKGMTIDWKNNSAHYLNQIVSFLTKNIIDFPEYESCVECDDTSSIKSNFGIYLGKSI